MTGDFREGARPKIVRGRPKAAHTLAAEAAGLSKHRTKTALRVASIPDTQFDQLVEGDQPPTVTALAAIGLQYRPRHEAPMQDVAPVSNLGALFRTAEPERNARLREFRLASLLLFGVGHTLTQAFADAIADPDALAHALTELDGLPAIPRRRLLATLASVLR